MRPEPKSTSRPIGDFLLGEWQVHPQHNELTSGHETRHLEPKTMDLLVFLAAAAPDVVSKNQIIDSVWEERIISEGTLTNAIAELRQVLGDDARHPRYIETIPKRGYCLIEPVGSVPSSTTDDARPRSRRARTALTVGAAVLTLAAVVIVTQIWQMRGQPLDPELVLVAPFVNRTGDRSFDSAALLARDRLVRTLSESDLVGAVPADSSDPSDSIDVLCDAARQSNAGLAVGGALYLHEGRLEVQAKLVDVQESDLLLSIPAVIVDRERISEALGQVVQRSVGAVATHRRAHGHFQLMSHTPVFEAYQEFIAGSELFSIDKAAAIRHLERAVELDRSFTSAQFRLSVAYRGDGRHADGVAVLTSLEERRSTLTEFERLWLDYFLAGLEHRRRDGLGLLRRIERIIPDDPVVQHMIVGNASGLNRPREVIAAMSAMMDGEILEGFVNNPLVVKSFVRCASAHQTLGDCPEALRISRAGLQRFPTQHDLLVAEARALTIMGDGIGFEEAVTRILSTPTGLTPANLLLEAAATARAHDRADQARVLARRAIAVLDDRANPQEAYVEAWLRAQALVLTDELDQAQTILEALRSRAEEGSAFQSLGVVGWLGAVSARRGDLETARDVDDTLIEYDGRYGKAWSAHYRAAIAAWLGHREQAVDLLSTSIAEGWGSFSFFHDTHRVLFEPLEGMPKYEALLHPAE